MVNLGAFIGGTALACTLKLTTSVDDLIWFSPFLTLCKGTKERIKCCGIYAMVCMLVTVASLVIAYLADHGLTFILEAMGNDGLQYWDSARILSLVAGILIAAYAWIEYREWAEEDENRCPTFKNTVAKLKLVVPRILGNPGEFAYMPVSKNSQSLDSDVTADSNEADQVEGRKQDKENQDEDDTERTIQEARKSSIRLFVVALCGTVDDMIMFAAVILGRSIPYFSLLIGSMFATGIIIFACWQISLYRPFSACIQKIPIWVLLLCLSAYILISGLLRT